MQLAELVKMAQYSDVLTRNEFAKILASYNVKIATEVVFQRHILAAQEANKIKTISMEEFKAAKFNNPSILIQHWDFKYLTEDLIGWATEKGFNLPLELKPSTKVLSERSEQCYLRIIGALLGFIRGKSSGIKPHPDYINDSQLIDVIEHDYQGYDGLSKSNLSRKSIIAIVNYHFNNLIRFLIYICAYY